MNNFLKVSNDMFALGFGLGTKNKKGEWLETFFPAPILSPEPEIDIVKKNTSLPWRKSRPCVVGSRNIRMRARNQRYPQKNLLEQLASSSMPQVISVIETDGAVKSTPEAYLKLHLLSSRLAKPNSMNLENIFTCLPTVAWTSEGAIDPNELEEVILETDLR